MPIRIKKSYSFDPKGAIASFLRKESYDSNRLAIFENLKNSLNSLTPSVDGDYSETLGEGEYYDLDDATRTKIEKAIKTSLQLENDPEAISILDALQEFEDDAQILIDAYDLVEKSEIDNVVNDINEILGAFSNVEDHQNAAWYSDWRTLLSGPNESRAKTLASYDLTVGAFVKAVSGTFSENEMMAHKSAKKLIKDIIKYGRDSEVLLEADTYDWVKKIRNLSGKTFSKDTGDFGNFDMFFDYFSGKPKTPVNDYMIEEIDVDENTLKVDPHLSPTEQVGGDYQNTVGTAPANTGMPSNKNNLKIDQLYQIYPSELHSLIHDINEAINTPERAEAIAQEFDVVNMSQNAPVAKIALKEIGDATKFLSSLGLHGKEKKYGGLLLDIQDNQQKLLESNWKDLGALKRIVRDFEIIADDNQNHNSGFSDEVFYAKKALMKNNWFVFVSSLDNFLENCSSIISYMRRSMDAPYAGGSTRIRRRERGFSADEETVDEIESKFRTMVEIYNTIINNPSLANDPQSRSQIVSFIGQFKVMAEELFDIIYGISTSKELIVSGEEFDAGQKQKSVGVRGKITRIVMEMAKNMKILEIYDEDLAFAMMKSARAKRSLSKKASKEYTIQYCQVYRGM